MSTVFVPATGFKVPMLCVACAQPTVMPANAAQKRASSIEVSASSRSGNTVTTERVSFQLCSACTAARALQKYRKSHYPRRGWTIGVGLFATAAFFGWLALYESPTIAWVGSDLFVVFVIATIAAMTVSRVLREHNDRDDPMSEDDRNRLALIEGAVSISPSASGRPTLAALTFKNEEFAKVFSAANANVNPWIAAR